MDRLFTRARELLRLTCTTLLLAFGSYSVGAAEAEQTYRVGFIGPGSAATAANYLQAFRDELRLRGYVEGRNLHIEYRYADGQRNRMPLIARELAQLKVDVMFVSTEPALLAAMEAGSGTPVVAVTCDPLDKMSLALKKGNATGFSCVASELAGKRLGFLKTIVPNLRRVALLYSAQDAYEPDLKHVEDAGQALGLVVSRFPVETIADFDKTFTLLEKDKAQAVYVALSGFTNINRKLIAQLCLKLRMASIFGFREYPEDGGLLSYGASNSDGFRRAAYFVDRILKGARPQDLPPEEPTRFELVVNGRTAATLGLAIPQDVLLLADEVIK